VCRQLKMDNLADQLRHDQFGLTLPIRCDIQKSTLSECKVTLLKTSKLEVVAWSANDSGLTQRTNECQVCHLTVSGVLPATEPRLRLTCWRATP
jgi:hypothetical protein